MQLLTRWIGALLKSTFLSKSGLALKSHSIMTELQLRPTPDQVVEAVSHACECNRDDILKEGRKKTWPAIWPSISPGIYAANPTWIWVLFSVGFRVPVSPSALIMLLSR